MASSVCARDGKDIYEGYHKSIVQIKIIERNSGEQSSLGSGFFVGEGNLLASNYHVVSSAVMEPEKYRATFEIGDRSIDLDILQVDVVNDLALLASPAKQAPLALDLALPAKGSKLYSLGNPHDIGLTLVEGNYNGLVESRFFDQIHFSGAINSGMSGGPVLSSEGKVVGINVATAGNQVGFLVPVKYLSALLNKHIVLKDKYPEFLTATLLNSQDFDPTAQQAMNDGDNFLQRRAPDAIGLLPEQAIYRPTEREEDNSRSKELSEQEKASLKAQAKAIKSRLMADITQQLDQASSSVVEKIFSKTWERVRIGDAEVLGEIHPAVECWGDSREDKERKLTIIGKGCQSNDRVYIDRHMNTVFVEYEFQYYKSDNRTPWSLYNLVSNSIANAAPGNRASKDDVRRYRCEDSLVTESQGRRKVVYCVRAYKMFRGLYDVLYVATSLDHEKRVLTEHYTFAGISMANAQKFLKAFLDTTRWP